MAEQYWYDNAVFYHIYPLGMTGAPFNAAEEEGVHPRILEVLDWIPHLQRLGINAVYFGPIFTSGTHGYDTHDYYTLDPRLGDNDDFAQICAVLHEAGIKVVLDGVFNHVGRGHFAFQDLLRNRESSPYRDWFVNVNFGGNNSYNDGFCYDNWGGCQELVKLNMYNPSVRQHLLGAIAQWMDDWGIDGLRLDAADCIQKDFFKELRYFVKSRRADFWLMGEIIHGDYKLWANAEMMDTVTNYECWKGLYSSHNDKNYFEIAHSLNRQFGRGGIYDGLRLYNFVDNHDVERIFSILKDKENLINVYTLMFTMPGIPSIYYGSEWGIEGAKDKSLPNQDMPLRPRIDIHSLEGINDELVDYIASLAHLYQSRPSIRLGTYENVDIKNKQLVFARAYEGEVTLVGLNLDSEPATLSGSYQGKPYHFELGPYESEIL